MKAKVGKRKETGQNPLHKINFSSQKNHREESNLRHNSEYEYQLINAAEYAPTDLASELEARFALHH